jgi:hypothetical protein
MSGAIPPFPNTPPWRDAQLKHRDNFTFLPFNTPFITIVNKYVVIMIRFVDVMCNVKCEREVPILGTSSAVTSVTQEHSNAHFAHKRH